METGYNVYSEDIPSDGGPSGSGPQFAGWFPNREEAEREVKSLQANGDAAWMRPDTAL